MTGPTSDAPQPAEASAAPAPEEPPVIVDVTADPMLSMTLGDSWITEDEDVWGTP